MSPSSRSPILPGCRPSARSMALAQPRSSWPSARFSRKNYARLIQALARLRHTDLKLVIAGGQGWQFDAIFAEVGRLGLSRRVIFPGFVADADLPALYSAAR